MSAPGGLTSEWWWQGWCPLDGALRVVVAGVVPSGWCPQGGGGRGGALRVVVGVVPSGWCPQGGGGGGGALWMVPSGWWWQGWCPLDASSPTRPKRRASLPLAVGPGPSLPPKLGDLMNM